MYRDDETHAEYSSKFSLALSSLEALVAHNVSYIIQCCGAGVGASAASLSLLELEPHQNEYKSVISSVVTSM
jgi:hypothetical protein